MTTHLQDYVELLNAEQLVQVDKLKEAAKHGVAARVRGVSAMWSSKSLPHRRDVHTKS